MICYMQSAIVMNTKNELEPATNHYWIDHSIITTETQMLLLLYAKFDLGYHEEIVPSSCFSL